MHAIVVRDLCKTYRGGVTALDGVSFDVGSGEIFGLLGPNGAGKSTTVRILATLSQPTSGSATVAGFDVAAQPDQVRARIGFVAQASGVDRFSTGRENLTLQAHLLRVPRAAVADRVSELLEWVDLSDVADRQVITYSGGMKRRLDVAMGLVAEPAVLFLDEPTTGLDPETRAALWRDLLRLKQERNLAVLLTTHYLDEADRLCDRLAIIDHGKIVVVGTPAELKATVSGDTVIAELVEPNPTAVEAVRALPDVIDATIVGRQVVAHVGAGASAIPAVVTGLTGAGAQVATISLSRPSLDDVYLHYTGHRFESDALDASATSVSVRQGGRA
ncbi:MAG: ATP-binding cassette domain-containing protein [Chloroflexota bacterium]